MDSYQLKFMLTFLREFKADRSRRAYGRLDAVRNRWYGPSQDAAKELLRQDSKAVYEAALKDRRHVHTAIREAMADRRSEWARYIKNVYMVVGHAAASPGAKAYRPGGLLDDNDVDEFRDEHGDWAADYVEAVGDEKAEYIEASHTKRMSTIAQKADDSGEDPVAALRDPALMMLLAVSLTEVACATNFGVRAGLVHDVTGNMNFMGELEKEWHCVPDGKARDTHSFMDGVRIQFDDPYDVDGDQMMFPGDSSMGASPSNFMNCRCYEIYYVDGTMINT
jgi:hypothetical protein